MSWVLLALLSGLSSNISNFFSRYLLKDGQDSTVFAWFFEAVRVAFFIFLAIFDFRLVFTFTSIVLLLAMGVTEFISIYLYMKMHANAHLSISSLISRTRLVWVPFFAFFLIGEHLKISTYLGIAILFLGLVVATAPHKLFADKGQWYAYGAAFVIGLNIVQLKMNTIYASPSLLVIFLALPTTIFFPFLMKNSRKRIKIFFSKQLLAKLGSAVVNLAAIYLTAVALQKGPVSIVNAIYQGTVIVAVLAGIFLLGEKKDIPRKLVGTAVTIIGVILLS